MGVNPPSSLGARAASGFVRLGNLCHQTIGTATILHRLCRLRIPAFPLDTAANRKTWMKTSHCIIDPNTSVEYHPLVRNLYIKMVRWRSMAEFPDTGSATSASELPVAKCSQRRKPRAFFLVDIAERHDSNDRGTNCRSQSLCGAMYAVRSYRGKWSTACVQACRKKTRRKQDSWWV